VNRAQLRIWRELNQVIAASRHFTHRAKGLAYLNYWHRSNRLVNRTITPVTEVRSGQRSTPVCLLPCFVRADIDCSLIQPRSP
jgi:hypothetical protein